MTIEVAARDRVMAGENLRRLLEGDPEDELAAIIAEAREEGRREGIAEEWAQIIIEKENRYRSVFLQMTLGAFYEIRERHRRRKAAALLTLSDKEFAKRLSTDEGKALLG